MDVQIGPHLYRNTDGTVEIEGVPQIEIALRKPGGPLRVNFVVMDAVGLVHAKIMESSMAVNERRAYELAKTPTSLVLKNLESGEDVLHVEIQEGDRVVISRGTFYTMKGHLMKITPLEWSVDKYSMKEGETDLQGKPISLA